jgi:hypothetical protein
VSKRRTIGICFVVPAIVLTLGRLSSALTYPFTEDFTLNTANWKNNASLDLNYVPDGGPGDSAHVSTSFSFVAAGPQVALFRGQDGFDSSGDAFVGNWLAANVSHLTGYVRHDAPVPLDFFVRVATSANSPAVSFTLANPIPAGQWSPVDFWISFDNPLHTNEGSPSMAFYNNVMSNVGNVQIGVISGPLLGNPTSFQFNLDRVSIVPEPASWIAALIAAIVGLARRARLN